LEEQLRAYGHLRDLSREEIALLESDPTERLGSLVNEKKELLDRLQHLDAKEEPLRTAWGHIRGKIPKEESEKIRTLGRAVVELVEENLHLQRQGEEAARERSVSIQRELASLAKGKNLNRAYYSRGDKRSRFLDRSG